MSKRKKRQLSSIKAVLGFLLSKNDCHFVNFLSLAGSSFFLSLKKPPHDSIPIANNQRTFRAPESCQKVNSKQTLMFACRAWVHRTEWWRQNDKMADLSCHRLANLLLTLWLKKGKILAWSKWRRVYFFLSPVISYFCTYPIKLHIFWEGHKILWNLHCRFDWHYIGQI